MGKLTDDIHEVLITEQQIADKVAELGQRISKDYENKNPLLLSVLKGSVVFVSDLLRKLTVACDIDFLSVTSYGKGTKSSGVVRILRDLDTDISNRHILVVEDILDSGLTLSYILEMLKARNPASIKLCTLLDKPSRRQVPVEVDYTGFVIPDEFVVGYGLDYGEVYRNLPYIGILKPEIYTL